VPSGLAENTFEADDFSRQDVTTKGREPVVPAAGIVVAGAARCLVYHTLVLEFLKVVVEGAGADLVTALGLAGDLQHNAVAVTVFASEGE
jgi:hypothetical protein